MLGFVQKRHGDRIGLIVFSENAYVVAPMTQDMGYLTNYLRMVDNKTLASEGQTAIGEGILTALNLAEQQKQESGKNLSKVMIVLTDGENNTGRDVYAPSKRPLTQGSRSTSSESRSKERRRLPASLLPCKPPGETIMTSEMPSNSARPMLKSIG